MFMMRKKLKYILMFQNLTQKSNDVLQLGTVGNVGQKVAFLAAKNFNLVLLIYISIPKALEITENL